MGEVTTVAGIRVTTSARTAFDLARHRPRDEAVARLDALMNARPFALQDVVLLAKCHRGVRGLRRLLFVDAGLPRPTTTQFVVKDEWGRYVRRIDMCWEDFKVGAEYDGEQHLTNRRQYVLDVRVNRELQRLDWHVIHVIKEDRAEDIVEQARTALLSRGWRP